MRTLLAAIVLLPGCFIVSDDDDCDYGGIRAEGDEAGLEAPQQLYRNPDSGQCDDLGGGGGGGTNCDRCGNCYDQIPEDREPAPDWGECTNFCTGLDETTCQATDACRAAYLTSCIGGGCPEEPYDYYGCWAVAPAGATRGGDCTLLGAYDCSRHDDCVTRHIRITDCVDCTSDPTVGAFESCAPEEPVPAACAELAEDACVEREDCAPLYEGVDCTCEGDACSCADWVFTDCE